MLFKDFKKERPAPGTRVMAFSPRYPRGNPDRLRMVTVTPVGMDEVTAYASVGDIEMTIMADALFSIG